MENLTPIEVLAKTTEAALRRKNADFLAQYPTDRAQINYYTQKAMKVFDEFEIDGTFTEHGVRENVETWFHNKRDQMNLFRKHPYWDEEAKAIVFSQNETRSIDYDAARCALNDILRYVENKLDDSRYDAAVMAISNTLYRMHRRGFEQSSVITEDFIRIFNEDVYSHDLPKPIARMLKVGTKITKFTHKCCTMWKDSGGKVHNVTTLVDEHEDGDRDYRSFDKLYAKFADYLSELTIKKITLVSLHFCDFLLMSNGNSWLSCHFINSHNIFHDDGDQSYSGCYKQGCLSYALDEPSFILYTLPATYDGDAYYSQPKMTRMCCQYQGGILVTGKCYPDNKDKTITRYRQTLQMIMSSVEAVPNLWTFSRNVDRITSLVTTECYSAHYRDYEYSNQKPTISLCKNIGIDLDNLMTIGHSAYCVHCGEELDNDDAKWLQCEKHRTKPICKHCGRYIEDEDDRIYIDDDIYCADCTFYCDVHGQYEPISWDNNHIELVDGSELTMCNGALRGYTQCSHCGKWYKNRSGKVHCGKCYCCNCYEKLRNDGTIAAPKNIVVVRQDEYEVGDYVLMEDGDTIDDCDFGANHWMRDLYNHRIAKIRRIDSFNGAYKLTIGNPDPELERWMWSANCFAGKLFGDNLSDELLGKTLEEVN